MASKTEAYVDTSAFIAFFDRSDSYYRQYYRLFAAPPALVTSSLVVAEGHGWFLRRYDSRKSTEFLRFITEFRPLSVFPFGKEDVLGVLGLVTKFEDQNLTLADAHGLALMGDRRIKACWSTDRHLGLTGVPLVN